MSKKEPEIIIEEVGTVTEEKLTDNVKPIQQKKPRNVQEILTEDVTMIEGISYTHSEAKKFVPIFDKIENDMLSILAAIEKELKQGGEKHAEADPE